MLALTIARRYLFAKKTHRAINAITLVATVGVAVISAALICTLSVYNGFEALVDDLCSAFDPDLRIEPAWGKTMADTPEMRHSLLEMSEVEAISATLEEDVLISYGGRQVTARIKGIDSAFAEVCDIESLTSLIADDAGQADTGEYGHIAIIGAGLATQLRIYAESVRPMTVYCPQRQGRISMLHPEDAFRQGDLFCGGLFAVQQSEYDDRYLLADIRFVRTLLADSTGISAYEVKLQSDADPKAAKAAILKRINKPDAPQTSAVKIQTRRELHSEAYRIMQIEKWISFLLIAFILLIASFNVIGALSMLIIDKAPEITTLKNLGASDALLRRIFAIEGWLISGVGACIGILLGVILCWLQEQFGLISLGDGSSLYIVDAYPVRLIWTDVVWTLLCVAAIGLLVSFITARQLDRFVKS